jgi:hypothetical protein
VYGQKSFLLNVQPIDCCCSIATFRLEYKYMKLIESTSGKDGELPAAETCALDEGEEDEQFDAAVEFRQKGRKLFGKFKHSTKKGKVFSQFHTHKLVEQNCLCCFACLIFLVV